MGQEDEFKFTARKNSEKNKLKYRLYLQKAKILYFDKLIERKKSIRKNSLFLSDFNIFKIKRRKKNGSIVRAINEKEDNKNLA